jgi:hypothetical protein
MSLKMKMKNSLVGRGLCTASCCYVLLNLKSMYVKVSLHPFSCSIISHVIMSLQSLWRAKWMIICQGKGSDWVVGHHSPFEFFTHMWDMTLMEEDPSLKARSS